MIGTVRVCGRCHYHPSEAEEAAKQVIARVNGMGIGDNTVVVGPFIKREKPEGVDAESSHMRQYRPLLMLRLIRSRLATLLRSHRPTRALIIQVLVRLCICGPLHQHWRLWRCRWPVEVSFISMILNHGRTSTSIGITPGDGRLD